MSAREVHVKIRVDASRYNAAMAKALLGVDAFARRMTAAVRVDRARRGTPWKKNKHRYGR